MIKKFLFNINIKVNGDRVKSGEYRLLDTYESGQPIESVYRDLYSKKIISLVEDRVSEKIKSASKKKDVTKINKKEVGKTYE